MTNLKRRNMGRSGLEPDILQEAEMLVAYLHSHLELDPCHSLHNFASNTIMTMLFGKRWDYGDVQYKAFTEAIAGIFDLSPTLTLEDMVQVFSYLPSVKTAKKEYSKHVRHIRKLFEDIIHERVAGNDADGNDSDIISDYMRIHKEMDKFHFQNIVDICQARGAKILR